MFYKLNLKHDISFYLIISNAVFLSGYVYWPRFRVETALFTWYFFAVAYDRYIFFCKILLKRIIMQILKVIYLSIHSFKSWGYFYTLCVASLGYDFNYSVFIGAKSFKCGLKGFWIFFGVEICRGTYCRLSI